MLRTVVVATRVPITTPDRCVLRCVLCCMTVDAIGWASPLVASNYADEIAV